MCGIFISICRDDDFRFTTKQVKPIISNRGPSSFNQLEKAIGCGWHAFLMGSVLWTQGESITVQPLVQSDGSFLLWNGDIYSGLPGLGNSCDAEVIFAELLANGLLALTKAYGPYAFIFYNASTNLLWFGRDPLGRHSLLWKFNKTNVLLTSACPRNVDAEEIACLGIYELDLSKSSLEIKLHPWHSGVDLDKAELPYSFGKELFHPCFQSSSEYDWYNREPRQAEIEFLSELAKDVETSNIFQNLILTSPLSTIVRQLKHLLIQSVKRRVETKPNYCSNCITSALLSSVQCTHAKVAVLFSGGLDSTILALIADDLISRDEPIDLYNVAFNLNGLKDTSFLVPDRKNGYQSWQELAKFVPERQWNFIEINVEQEELEELRRTHIANLIHPLSTILDDSLGCALWFAARGKGTLNGLDYDSPARIVLLGMGADEMFGGYTRHRKVYRDQGWRGLGLQLIEELGNINRRNLGRDNRVVTDHGRQPRLPYLDEDLVKFVSSIPPWHRCCLSPDMAVGVGDKMLLRCIAWDLGLRYCSTLPKKALQFGSKIANPKEKGHELSARLLAAQEVQ